MADEGVIISLICQFVQKKDKVLAQTLKTKLKAVSKSNSINLRTSRLKNVELGKI